MAGVREPAVEIEGGADERCGSGSWGGQRPSLASYVAVTGPTGGATAPPEGGRVVFSDCPEDAGTDPAGVGLVQGSMRLRAL